MPASKAVVPPAPRVIVAAGTLVLSVLAPVAYAMPAQEPSTTSAVSIDRIRRQLQKPPTVKLDAPVRVPVATFKSRVERAYVPTVEEWINKEFALTALQRQSAEWGAKCCGLDLGDLFKGINAARRRNAEQRLRDRIREELAQIEAARKKAADEAKR